MWRLERLEPEDSLLDDDDEWLDDAIAIVYVQVISARFSSLSILCWVFSQKISFFIYVAHTLEALIYGRILLLI